MSVKARKGDNMIGETGGPITFTTISDQMTPDQTVLQQTDRSWARPLV